MINPSMFLELHVHDIDTHYQLFSEVIGFETVKMAPNFITLNYGGVKLLLTKVEFEEEHQFYDKLNPDNNGYGVEIGIQSKELDQLRERIIQFGKVKTVTKIKLQDWGKRDFRVTTSENYYLRFTEFKNPS